MKNELINALARRAPITKKEWHVFLESRRQDIIKHIKSVTLLALGDIPFLNDYFGAHNLKRDAQYIETERDCLESRGIFPTSSHHGAFYSNTEYERNGPTSDATGAHHTFWGINREGKWMLVKVYATITREPYKYPSRFENTQRARRIEIIITEDSNVICEACHIHPRKIWNRLGEVLTEWISHRESLLRELKHLDGKFSQEQLFVDSVPTETE